MKKIALSFALVASLATIAAGESRKLPATQNPTLTEIQNAFGFVPDFIKGVPDALLPGFWSGITGLEMNPATKLDGKTKELIGLAVAAQVPCEVRTGTYCSYSPDRAARSGS